MQSQRLRFMVLFSALLLAGLFRIGMAADPPNHPARPGIIDPAEGGFDFVAQGEYSGTLESATGEKPFAAQVIALGQSRFQAVFLNGGLPGAGWDGGPRLAVDGVASGTTVRFAPAQDAKAYLGGGASFSALRDPQPASQPNYQATLEHGMLRGTTAEGAAFTLKKTERQSPTLGEAPPAGALVLLAYQTGQPPSLDGWSNTLWRAMPDGSMMTVHRDKSPVEDSVSAQPFGLKSFRLHVEFKTSFMPGDRGQGRANSGVFPPPGREVQVLDSFGLAGEPNECGGIYKDYAPAVNMCLPPLSWQTYDIDYTSPADAPGGEAFYRIMHNGVPIQEHLVLPDPPQTARSLILQDHLNNIFYRNIWVMER